MKIPSDLIPQADKLEIVIDLVKAVSEGAESFQDFALQIAKVERQGRYYRKAAEIIGLVENYHNRSELTPLGLELINAELDRRQPIILRAVLTASIFQRIIPFLEKNRYGVSRSELTQFLNEVADFGARSMAYRRVSTLISWLKSLNIVQVNEGGLLILQQNYLVRETPMVEFADNEPLLPNTSDLREYTQVAERAVNTSDSFYILRDQAKMDRANAEHQRLVNMVAGRLGNRGAIPKYNKYIDLAASISSKSYIFEMKSTNIGNTHSQIRNGLSQLYEYRYMQATPDAHLVLAISEPLSQTERWLIDYLEKDRDVYLIWDGENQLHASSETRRNLDFLW